MIKFIKVAVYFVLFLFSNILNPNKLHVCRFTPTCTVYARDAMENLGLIKGLGYALMRFMRCHPFSKAGYDPVTPGD